MLLHNSCSSSLISLKLNMDAHTCNILPEFHLKKSPAPCNTSLSSNNIIINNTNISSNKDNFNNNKNNNNNNSNNNNMKCERC